jgi:hypothetical protein
LMRASAGQSRRKTWVCRIRPSGCATSRLITKSKCTMTHSRSTITTSIFWCRSRAGAKISTLMRPTKITSLTWPRAAKIEKYYQMDAKRKSSTCRLSTRRHWSKEKSKIWSRRCVKHKVLPRRSFRPRGSRIWAVGPKSTSIFHLNLCRQLNTYKITKILILNTKNNSMRLNRWIKLQTNRWDRNSKMIIS